jgi:hypothetical protein
MAKLNLDSELVQVANAYLAGRGEALGFKEAYEIRFDGVRRVYLLQNGEVISDPFGSPAVSLELVYPEGAWVITEFARKVAITLLRRLCFLHAVKSSWDKSFAVYDPSKLVQGFEEYYSNYKYNSTNVPGLFDFDESGKVIGCGVVPPKAFSVWGGVPLQPMEAKDFPAKPAGRRDEAFQRSQELAAKMAREQAQAEHESNLELQKALDEFPKVEEFEAEYSANPAEESEFKSPEDQIAEDISSREVF